MMNNKEIDILVVDDKPNNLLAMEALLEEDDRNVVTATSGNQALGLMLEHDFALVILDIQMPDMDGIETARLMRQNNKTRQIPIIFVTAINKERQHVFEGYNAGAVDYIFKPFEPIIFKSKINVLLQLHKQKRTIELTNIQLSKMVYDLEMANRKILYQHKTAIEEERLKVILQLAGATACEMNQPLNQLLTCIEHIKDIKDSPAEQAACLDEIKKSGTRIFQIAKRIQSMQISEENMDQAGAVEADNRNLPAILSVGNREQDFGFTASHMSDTLKMNFMTASSIDQALTVIAEKKIDMIITDYMLIDGTGFDLLGKMKQEGIDIPVIFITDNGDEIIAARAIKEGACDYLTRSALTKDLFIKTLSNTLEKERLRKDISAAYQRLAVLSTRDSLTKLFNRRYFDETMETEISKVKRYGSEMSVCMIDLDRFKYINDQFGHLVGDKILSKTAGILKDLVRECDVVCRYGGEEFGLILPKTYSRDAFVLGERIRKEIAAHEYKHDSATIGVTVSIGIASYKQDMDTSKSMLINEADLALYAAKSNGRNRVEIYDHNCHEGIELR